MSPREGGSEAPAGLRRTPRLWAHSAAPGSGPAPPFPPHPSPPRPLRHTHHGEARGVRSAGNEVPSAAAAAAAARAPPRVRASTLTVRSARAAAPPPPAPTVPQRPRRAPRLTRPRPARRRTAAPMDPSAPRSALTGPWIACLHPSTGEGKGAGFAAGRARARSRLGTTFCRPRPAFCVFSSLAEGYFSEARDKSLCEPRRYWARPIAEMRAQRRLVRPSLQCVKLG
jgi:hypothetical protein